MKSKKQPIEMKNLLTTNADMKILAPGDQGAAKYGSLTGYASTFANTDRVGDVIQKGAFLDTIPNFLTDGFIAIGHDWDSLPVATVTSAIEDDKGLYCTADFHSTAIAQEARTVATERLERGKSVGLSIGFRVLDYDYLYEEDEADDEDDWLSFFMPKPMLIKKVELYEFSLVTVPCNPMATVTGAKGLPPAGLPYAEHSIAVRAAVKEFVERTRELTAMRRKEGRAISATNQARLQAISDSLRAHAMDLDQLVGAASPAEPVGSADAEASTSIIDMGKNHGKNIAKKEAPAPPNPPEESPVANVVAQAAGEVPPPVNDIEDHAVPIEEARTVVIEQTNDAGNETEAKIRQLQAELSSLQQMADLTAKIAQLKASMTSGGSTMPTPSASTDLTIPAVPAKVEEEWDLRGDMVVPVEGERVPEAPPAHVGQIDGDIDGVITIDHPDDPDADDERGVVRPNLTILSEAPKDGVERRASDEDVRKEMARLLELQARFNGVRL